MVYDVGYCSMCAPVLNYYVTRDIMGGAGLYGLLWVVWLYGL